MMIRGVCGEGLFYIIKHSTTRIFALEFCLNTIIDVQCLSWGMFRVGSDKVKLVKLNG